MNFKATQVNRISRSLLSARSDLFLMLRVVLGLLLAMITAPSQSRAVEIGYAGRLQESSGKSVDGPLDFTVRFYNTPSQGEVVGPTLKLAQTELIDGVFQLSLNFDNSQFAAIFGDGAKPVFVEIEAGDKVYPRQRLLAVPLALRVPVDGDRLNYTSDGKLTVDRVDLTQVTGLSAALAGKADASAAITAAGKVSGSAINSGTITGTTAFNTSGGITTSAAISGSGNMILGGTGLASTELRFNDNDNSNYVSLKAPGTVGSNVTFVLPAADGGSGQVLSTNGAGSLGWSSLGGPALVTLTDGPTINVNAALGSMFQVTLGGNRTLAAPTNQTPGATYLFKFSQDGTGGRTLAFDPVFVFPASISTPQLSYAPNSVDIGQFASDGTNMYYLTGWMSNATVQIPPGNLTATAVSPTEINLAWVDNNDTEIGYRIDRSPDNSTWTNLGTTWPNQTSFADTSLSESTRYYYRVVTVRDAGNSAPVYANAWTLLNAQTSFTASVSSTSAVVLTWVDNTTLETGYAVERSLTGTGGWTLVTTTAANAVTYTDTGLSQATRYHYRVRAINANTSSSYSGANEITFSSGICGTSSADNCYLFTNMPLNTQLSTPTGKNLILVYANGTSGLKIWKENSSNRVLRANGLDQWTKRLNENGRGLSVTDFTDANFGTSNTLLAGRVCPTNVYIDDSNMTTTGNCVYYSPGYAAQRLDAPQYDDTTNQTTTGNFRLGPWNTAAGGNGTGASWYEGNIQTCAATGMRLPTLYETTLWWASDTPTDANPVYSGSSGVPDAGGMTWTATAITYHSSVYIGWQSSGSYTTATYDYSLAIRCVLP